MASKKGTPPLAVTHPALAKQANGWDPNEVTAGSGRKLSWKCLKGHIYLMAIYNRTGKPEESCPICSNHQVLVGYNDLATTHPEIAKEADGWDPTTVTAGSNKKLRWKCSNSHTYESTITSRTKTGNSCAICVNQRVLVGYNDLATTHPAVAIIADGWDPTTVVWGSNKKKQWKCVKGHSFEASINSITSRSAGCSVCAGKQILVGYNDLATTHPEIALEADGWDPRTVTAGSNSKQSWKCKKGHVYRVDPNHRVGQGGGCPFCSGRQVLAGFNDLATTHPEIAKEADGWDPTTVVAGTAQKRKWKCKNGHASFEQAITNRTGQGNGCPSCASSGFDPGKDAWLYFMRHEEFNYLQIGITNQPEVRLKTHERLGWELLEIRGPMDGHLCARWEKDILRMLRAKGANMGPSKAKIKVEIDNISKVVHTEMWSYGSFPVTSIIELMRHTEDYEENQGINS